MCADEGLLLSRYDFLTVRHRLASLCCVEGGLPTTDARCSSPWPAPAPIPCTRWVELQAALMARYGKVFKDPAEQARYEAMSWYEPNPSFTVSEMTITAKRNVQALDRYARERIDCE